MPTKVDLTPKRHHGFSVLLFILGTLFPPLAVAARFGIGGDFWLNLLLTICGYIPGHVHNFYIQNIRNNKNHKRTPKWAQRYGLVNTSKIQRNQKKSQWASRYNDRLPHSTLQDQPFEEGQDNASNTNVSVDGAGPRGHQENGNGELWRPEDETYYGRNGDTASDNSHGRWRYPANFEDAAPSGGIKKSKKKKDRWARTEDAYSLSEEVPKKKKKSKRRKNKASVDDGSINTTRSEDTSQFPEDAEGGLYARRGGEGTTENGQATGEEVFNHEF